jgi:hypothetical protein
MSEGFAIVDLSQPDVPIVKAAKKDGVLYIFLGIECLVIKDRERSATHPRVSA